MQNFRRNSSNYSPPIDHGRGFDYYLLSNSNFAPLPVADRSIKATALINVTSGELIYSIAALHVSLPALETSSCLNKVSWKIFETTIFEIVVSSRFDGFHYVLSGRA